MTGTIGIKRIYEPSAKGDGLRVLVDRLWPRGVSRDKADLDHWFKDISPSPEIRTWFGHDPARFDGFRDRYRHELDANGDAVDQLCAWVDQGDVTLLYAARDEHNNHALILAEYIAERGGYRFQPPA
ncbi:MAG: DUF488 domain-containing protein [Sphingobium sp.]